MPDIPFDPADPACWIAHGRKPEHAALIAAAWRDHPDLPPSAQLGERQARSRARIAAMNPVNEQIRQDAAREQEARTFAFTEDQVRLGRASTQDAAILAGRDRHDYGWLRSVDYAWGWTAAQAGWEYRPPGRNLLGIVPAGSTEAYAQGFDDGGGRRDDLFDTARRQFVAASQTPKAVRESAALSRPLPSTWPQPADMHRSVAWNRRLVILAATATRNAGPPAPAIDLLEDPVASEIQRVPGIRQARIVILSATHGFIDGQAPRAPWSEAITPERAAALVTSPEVYRQLAELVAAADIEDILVAAQDGYLAIIDAHAKALPLCRVMERTGGPGMGRSGLWCMRTVRICVESGGLRTGCFWAAVVIYGRSFRGRGRGFESLLMMGCGRSACGNKIAVGCHSFIYPGRGFKRSSVANFERAC